MTGTLRKSESKSTEGGVEISSQQSLVKRSVISLPSAGHSLNNLYLSYLT